MNSSARALAGARLGQTIAGLVAALAASLAVVPLALAADGADVERTLAVIELRSGEVADSQTGPYLDEVVKAFRLEAPGDVILVDGKTTADKVRKDREQVPSAVTPERRQQLAEARKRGVDLLDNADFQGAIKALVSAESRYRGAIAAPGADENLRKEYLDVLAQLATAYVAAGDKPAAVDVFRTVITTFGLKAPVTDDNYRPDVVELFKTEVKKVEKMPKGSVEVTSNPPGARIILGGNDRAATPATVADLIPGNYGIRLQSGDQSSMLHKVEVKGGGVAKFTADIGFESHLALEEDHVGLMYSDLKAAEARLVADAVMVGKDIEVNLVCVVGVSGGKLNSYLIDVAGARIVRSATDVKVPKVGISPRAVNRVLVTILGEKADKNVVEPGGGGGGGGGVWYKSTPGWIAAGGAVVLLGTGAAFSKYLNLSGITAYYCADPSAKCDGYNTPHNKLEYDQQVKDYVASSETKAMVAGVGLGAGVALAGLAGYLFYAESQKGEATAHVVVPSGNGTAKAMPVLLPPLSLASGPQRFMAR
ncbi:MAG: PEGA domain-containing protein [Deltaproteobacteria bacterium]|nr:PEGA domain-containing protein [Deltaproteobacteria bacterium]